jgi:superfamily II DNA or RNA helicase
MFYDAKSITIGDSVKIIVGKYYAKIIGDVPTEIIDEGCRFYDAKAAKIIRDKNFSPEADKQITEALLDADFGGKNINSGDPLDRQTPMSFKKRRILKEATQAKIDNYVHLFNKDTKEFPIGLVKKVKELLYKEGITVEVVDERKVPAKEFDFEMVCRADGRTPRPHQQEGSVLTDKYESLLYDWATNSGKTCLMALLIARKGLKTLIVTHSGHLAYQLQEEISSWVDIKPTVCAAGKIKLSPVTIAIVNTARNNLAEILAYGFEMVLIDEAHRAAAASYVKVLRHLSPYYNYGFTGTAFRNKSDGIVLEALYGSERPRITNLEMIEKGYSCNVDIEFDIVDQSSECDKLDPYHMVYKDGLVRSEIFNAAVIDKIVEHADAGHNIVVQVAQKAHGNLIHEILHEYEITSVVVDGDSNGIVNFKKLNDFKAGVYQVAIGTVINEGFDHDKLDVVVNAAGYCAKGLSLQKLGRVLRIGQGKDRGYYVDFYSIGHPILCKHSRMRAETMEKQGFKVAILDVIREQERIENEKLAKEQEKSDKTFYELKQQIEKTGVVTTSKFGSAKKGFVKLKDTTVEITNNIRSPEQISTRIIHH